MSNEPIKPGHNVVLYSGPTRFGQPGGPDPSAAAKKMNEVNGPRMCVRAAIRRMAGIEMDVTDGTKLTMAEIAKVFSPSGKRMTLAEMTAFRKFTKAILDGDVKAMQLIEDAIAGKLPNVQVNADVSLAELIAQARGELRDESANGRIH